MSEFDLTGKTAFVSGASRGLGKQFSVALAKAGADVVMTSRKPEDLAETVNLVEAEGRKAWPVALDVREQGSIEAAAEEEWKVVKKELKERK